MKNLLPNGSVVLLKGGNHRIMIYGRAQRDQATDKLFDYAGCYYPEGMLDSNEVMLFNNEDIDSLFFIGFQDVEELEYRKLLEEKLEEIRENEKDLF